MRLGTHNTTEHHEKACSIIADSLIPPSYRWFDDSVQLFAWRLMCLSSRMQVRSHVCGTFVYPRVFPVSCIGKCANSWEIIVPPRQVVRIHEYGLSRGGQRIEISAYAAPPSTRVSSLDCRCRQCQVWSQVIWTVGSMCCRNSGCISYSVSKVL